MGTRIGLAHLLLVAVAWAQQTPFPVQEGDHLVRGFEFASGQKLDELRLHYVTLGKLNRDSAGRATNAVLIMHGTGGTGRALLDRLSATPLFAKGGLLDVERYFVIFPDAIGHGKSSKPSDGLRTRFPNYRYVDMVRAHHLMVRDALKVDHLRLVMGMSMGGMHTWVWGTTFPDFMDALMPLASAPVEIAGRNRMFRAQVIQAIRGDPAWKNGDYTEPPVNGLTAAAYASFMMSSAPLQLHATNSNREKADDAVALLRRNAATGRTDANDQLYAFESSAGYDPSPHLEKITAPLYAINSADDEVNPPELGILEREIKKVRRGRYILIPTSMETRGHGTHTIPKLWSGYLAELLRESEPQSVTSRRATQ